MNNTNDVTIEVTERYVNKALNCVAHEQYNEATKIFYKLLDINPNSDLVHNWLGRLYLQQGRYKEAIEQFETYIKLFNEGVKAVIEEESDGPVSNTFYPYPVSAYVEIAVCYKKLGDDQKVREITALADKHAGKEMELLIRREQIASEALEPDSIGAILDDINVSLSRSHQNLGFLIALCGDYKKAIEEFQKALNYNQSNAIARVYLNMAIDKHVSGEEWLKDMLSLAKMQKIVMEK